MKTRTKMILSILAVLLLIGTATTVYLCRAGDGYYAMGGTVTVVSKDRTDSGYSITIEQGGVGGQYTLACSKEQFESVDIGDVINCDRDQSEMTRTGIVHNIRET